MGISAHQGLAIFAIAVLLLMIGFFVIPILNRSSNEELHRLGSNIAKILQKELASMGVYVQIDAPGRSILPGNPAIYLHQGNRNLIKISTWSESVTDTGSTLYIRVKVTPTLNHSLVLTEKIVREENRKCEYSTHTQISVDQRHLAPYPL